MENDTISVAGMLRDGIATEKHQEAFAIAARDLSGDERRWLEAALARGEVPLLAQGVYSIPSPAGVLRQLLRSDLSRPLPPPPHETAIALCRQNHWRLALPPAFARFLLGLAERPLQLPKIPYDQPERRHYKAAGLTLVPCDHGLRDLTIPGQALTLAAPREASVQKLMQIGVHASRGMLGLPKYVAALQRDIDNDHLGERELIIALSLIDAAGQVGFALQAPADWMPPAPDETLVRIEDWRIRHIEDLNGAYHCLTALVMIGHPVLGDTNLAYSSPLIWLDERAGYARTVSRIYRLGRKAFEWD